MIIDNRSRSVKTGPPPPQPPTPNPQPNPLEEKNFFPVAVVLFISASYDVSISLLLIWIRYFNSILSQIWTSKNLKMIFKENFSPKVQFKIGYLQSCGLLIIESDLDSAFKLDPNPDLDHSKPKCHVLTKIPLLSFNN